MGERKELEDMVGYSKVFKEKELGGGEGNCQDYLEDSCTCRSCSKASLPLVQRVPCLVEKEDLAGCVVVELKEETWWVTGTGSASKRMMWRWTRRRRTGVRNSPDVKQQQVSEG